MGKAIVLFANHRNVGDQLSARGIERLLGRSTRLVAFERRFSTVHAEIDRARPDTLFVIGGGGLLKAPFQRFWDEVVGRLARERRRYVIWGVGGCREWEGERFRPPRSVFEGAELVAVRDDASADLIGLDRVIVSPCPSHRLIVELAEGYSGLREPVLLQVDHPELLARLDPDRGGVPEFSAFCEAVAEERGLRVQRVDNLVGTGHPLAPRFHERLLRRSLGRRRSHRREADQLVGSYASSSLVITSRLHGAVIAASAGVPLVAFSKDPKIDAYLRTVGLEGALMHDLVPSGSPPPGVADPKRIARIRDQNDGIAASLS